MADEKKIGVVVLWKNNEAYFGLTSEKRAELSKEWKEIKERWEEKTKLVVSYSTVGTGKFDGFEVWEVTDLENWRAFNEEALRCWSKYLEYYESYIGINAPYSVKTTKDILY